VAYAFLSLVPLRSIFYTLSLHDALPISIGRWSSCSCSPPSSVSASFAGSPACCIHPSCPSPTRSPRSPWWGPSSSPDPTTRRPRSEEHTSELQSRGHLVCRLLLEKKHTY